MEPLAHLPQTPTHRFAVVGLLTLFLASSGATGYSQPLDPPRETSSDALAYVLEVEKELAEEELSLVGSLVGGPGTFARWQLDGRHVPPGALARVRANRVRTVRIDTSDAVLVETLTEATPEHGSVESVELFSSEAVSRRLGASAPFTFIRARLSVDPRPHLFGAGR